MSRRVLLTSAVIVLLLGAIVVAPGLPPVRDALLRTATGQLERSGVDLAYDQAAGNAWRGVALGGATLSFAGATLTFDELELDYHLPSLLGGELPLSVTARGVRGDVDLDGIVDELEETVGGSGGGLPIRVVLREVEVTDIELRAANAPFTLPDATLSDLRVTPEPGALELGARITTDHGSVAAEGRLQLPSLDFAGTVTHADVSVARQWWDGAVAGTATGPVSVRRGQVNADLRIEDAAIEQSGIEVTGISGTASLRYPRIRADLTGTGLGGPLRARGTVDVAAQQYDVDAEAAPQLADAAEWLAGFAELGELPVEAEGRLSLTANVAGWKAPTIRAAGTGAGALAGLPLGGLDATLDMRAGGPMRGGLTATLAGGPLTASLAPSAAGHRLVVEGRGVPLADLNLGGFDLGGVVQGLRADIELTPSLTGSLTASWAGELAELDAVVELDGRIDPDGLQAYFTASAAGAGAEPLSATGAAVFSGGRLEAGLSLAELPVPALDQPLRLGLAASGPLHDLALTATVENPQPLHLALGFLQPDQLTWETAPLRLNGSASGRLVNGAIEEVRAAFGPLALAGRVELQPLSANFQTTLAPVELRLGGSGDAAAASQEADSSEAPPPDAATGATGDATGDATVGATLSMSAGALRYAADELTFEGRAQLEGARAGPALLDLEELDVAFRLPVGAADPEAVPGSAPVGWTLDVAEPAERLRLAVRPGSEPLALTLSGLPVHLAGGRPAEVSGELRSAGGDLRGEASLAPGSRLGGVELVNGAEFALLIDPAASRLELDGSVGAVPLEGAVDWAGGAVAVAGEVADLRVELTPATGAWRLAGASPLAPLLAEVGVSGLEAAFAGDVAYDGAYVGAGTFSVDAPLALTLALQGAQDELRVTLDGEVGGVPIEGEGALTEPLFELLAAAFGPASGRTPGLLVDFGPFRDVTLDTRGLRGAGEVAAMGVGPLRVGPVPWSLAFDWEGTRGFVETADEVLEVALVDGEIQAAGSLGAEATYGGATYRLSAWPGAAAGERVAVRVADLPDLRVGGALGEVGADAPLATLGGSVSELTLELDAALADLAAALPEGVRPAGRLRATAEVDLLAGPEYGGSLTLTPPAAAPQAGLAADAQEAITATFAGVGGTFDLSVDGAGLTLQHVPGGSGAEGRFTLTAAGLDLGRFLPPEASGTVDGALSYGAGGWSGALDVDLAARGEGDAPLLAADATLTGAGRELLLALSGRGAADAAFRASGALLPEPELAGTYSLLGEAVAGEFSWRDGLDATVTSAEQRVEGVATLPAQSARVRLDPDTGVVSVTGSTIDARLEGGELAGRLALPLDLLEQPALLTLDLAGPLADPRATAELRLTGPPALEGEPIATISGSLGEGAALAAQLSAAQLRALLPSGAAAAADYLREGATATATLSPAGEWQAGLIAPLTAPQEELALALVAAGSGATYRGDLHLVRPTTPAPTTASQLVAAGERLAHAEFAGTGADAAAALDLGVVAWAELGEALGVPLDIDGGGELTFTTTPLRAALTLDLTGRVGENAVRVSGAAPDDLTLSIAGPNADLDGRLAWADTLEGGGSAELTGSLAGYPTLLRVALDAGLGSGALELQAAGATLKARLQGESGADPDAARRTVTLEAAAPAGTLAPFGAEAAGTVTLEGAAAHLDDLTARLSGLLEDPAGVDAEFELTLAGPLTPAPDLAGSLSAPRLGEAAAVRLTDAGGLTAEVAWRDLKATARLGDGQGGPSLGLAGSAGSGDVAELLNVAAPALGPAVLAELTAAAPRLSAVDLAWSAGAGWRGGLAAEADAPWLAAAPPVTLSGQAADGALHLDARAEVEGGHASLTAELPAALSPTAPLTGGVTLDLPGGAVGLEGVDGLRLLAGAEVGGTLGDPTATGDLTLLGPVAATGRVRYASGSGALTLEGPHLTASAELSPGGASAAARLSELPLDAWLPQLPGGRLSLNARLAGTQVSLSDLALTAPNSLVTGTATLRFGGGGTDADGPSLSASLATNLDLSALEVGASLTGNVRGPLVINSADLARPSQASVIANLAAHNVGVEGAGGSLSGSFTLGGHLGDPSVNAHLVGDGSVRGYLSLAARPVARSYSVSSTLALGQLATDLRVEVGPGAPRASGSLRYGEGLLLLGDGAAEGAPLSELGDDLTVTGAGRFTGLRARVAADLSRAEVGFDLEGLGAGLDGDLLVTLDSRAGSWLAGSVGGVSVAGVELGSLALSSASLGDTVHVRGESLTATFEPNGLAWQLEVDGLALGSGATPILLSASGTGSSATGSLAATLDGPELALEAHLAQGEGTQLSLQGEAYGGAVALTGSRLASGGQWVGGGSLRGAHLAGFELDADATLLGAELLPRVVLATTASNGVTISGNASVGPGGVTVDQLVRGAPLEQALRLQGRVLPDSDLTLSTLDLEEGALLTPASAALTTTSSVRLYGAAEPAGDDAPGLRAAGRLSLPFGPARVELAGEGGAPAITASLLGLPSWRAAGELRAADLLDLVARVMEEGLTLRGQEALRGEVHLDPSGPGLRLDGFGVELGGLSAGASGSLSLTSADVTGELTLSTDLPLAERASGYHFPWRLTADGGEWRLESRGAHGEFTASYGPGGDLALAADLALSEGRVVGQLGLQGTGLMGTLSVTDVRLASAALGAFVIDAEAAVADGRIGGSGSLQNEAGRMTVTGNWGLGGFLPAAVAPGAPTGGRLEARLRSLELSEVPLLAELLPELSGQVSGAAQLRDGFLLGQLVAPEVAVADLSTPLELTFNGSPSALSLDVRLRGALGRASLASGVLSGMFRFERFPLNLLSTAVVGASDFTADLTGVMRFEGPLATPQDGYLRLATEEIRLERMGVTTTGNVTVTYDDNALLVDRAEFAGAGEWRAAGVLRPDLYDFGLEAVDADFTPLLGLVPQFARLGVGAAGSFDLSVSGNVAAPSIELTSPELQVAVSGSRYRLEETVAALEGVEASLETTLHGVAPVTGSLEVSGGAFLSLFPFALSGTELALAGGLELAAFGTLTEAEGAFRQLPDGTPIVTLTGLMGANPLTVEGTLAPLELRAAGDGVTIAFPSLMVERAVVDADLRLVSLEGGGVALGGEIDAEEVVVDPAVRSRPEPAPQPAPAQPEDPATVELIPDVEAPPAPVAESGPSGGLAALRFDTLRIRAPGRVTLTTNIGSFEAGLDLALSGTGAEPRLAGTATALRGNLRFGGRDFNIDRAVATFSPNRGVYPELDVAARAEFDKTRVISAAPAVSFVAPREGSTFEVSLAFFGPVEPSEQGGFRFDIQPVLSSNALIEVEGEAVGSSAARPLTEAELMSLVTLGRFELNADLIGAGGLGEAVATGALDTAIDLLVVSGLEGALREALGLDVVEIRTSSISSLLDDGGQPFGVSVRVGGYLQPELFASYRIGTYDGGDADFSLTNEVLLRYALGPVDVDVFGRVDIPTAGTLELPRPELGVLLGYQLSPLLGVEGGVTLGSERSKVEFGVTLRW